MNSSYRNNNNRSSTRDHDGGSTETNRSIRNSPQIENNNDNNNSNCCYLDNDISSINRHDSISTENADLRNAFVPPRSKRQSPIEQERLLFDQQQHSIVEAAYKAASDQLQQQPSPPVSSQRKQVVRKPQLLKKSSASSSISSSYHPSYNDTDDLICGPVGSFAEDSPIRGSGSASISFFHPSYYSMNSNNNDDKNPFLPSSSAMNATAAMIGTTDDSPTVPTDDDLFAKWKTHLPGYTLQPSSSSKNRQQEDASKNFTFAANVPSKSKSTAVTTEWKDIFDNDDVNENSDSDEDDDSCTIEREANLVEFSNNNDHRNLLSTRKMKKQSTSLSQDFFRNSAKTSVNDVSFRSPSIFRNDDKRKKERNPQEQQLPQQILSPNYRFDANYDERDAYNSSGNNEFSRTMGKGVAVSTPLAPSSSATNCTAASGILNTLSSPNPSLYTDYPDLATKLRFDDGTPLYNNEDDDDNDVMNRVVNIDHHDFVFSPPHLQHQQPFLSSSPPPPIQFANELLEGVRRSPLQSSSERKMTTRVSSIGTLAKTSISTPTTKKPNIVLNKKNFVDSSVSTKRKSDSTSSSSKKRNSSFSTSKVPAKTDAGSLTETAIRRMTMGEPQSSRSLADINNMMRGGKDIDTDTLPSKTKMDRKTTPVERKSTSTLPEQKASSRAPTNAPLSVRKINDQQATVLSQGNKKKSVRRSQLTEATGKHQSLPVGPSSDPLKRKEVSEYPNHHQQQFTYPYGYQYTMPSQHYPNRHQSRTMPPPPSSYQYQHYYDTYSRHNPTRRSLHATTPIPSLTYRPPPGNPVATTPGLSSSSSSPHIALPPPSAPGYVAVAAASIRPSSVERLPTQAPPSGFGTPATPRFNNVNGYKNTGARLQPVTTGVASTSDTSSYGGSASRQSHPPTPYGWPASGNSNTLNTRFMSPQGRTGALILPTSRPSPLVSSSGKENIKGSAGEQQQSSSASSRKLSKRNACNCKKSRCLKLYCECFSSQDFCDGCNCVDCCNTEDHAELRDKAMRELLHKNKAAFDIKTPGGGGDGTHSVGCKCRRSECLKKYCECFQAGIVCTEGCKCSGCENRAGSQKLIDKRRKMKDAKGAEYAMQLSKEIWEQPQRALIVQKPPVISSRDGRSSGIQYRPLGEYCYSRQAKADCATTLNSGFSSATKSDGDVYSDNHRPVITPGLSMTRAEAAPRTLAPHFDSIPTSTFAVTASIDNNIAKAETGERSVASVGVRRLSFDSTNNLTSIKKQKQDTSEGRSIDLDFFQASSFRTTPLGLPSRVLGQIFQSLSKSDLRNSAQVCKQWKLFVTDYANERTSRVRSAINK